MVSNMAGRFLFRGSWDKSHLILGIWLCGHLLRVSVNYPDENHCNIHDSFAFVDSLFNTIINCILDLALSLSCQRGIHGPYSNTFSQGCNKYCSWLTKRSRRCRDPCSFRQSHTQKQTLHRNDRHWPWAMVWVTNKRNSLNYKRPRLFRPMPSHLRPFLAQDVEALSAGVSVTLVGLGSTACDSGGSGSHYPTFLQERIRAALSG